MNLPPLTVIEASAGTGKTFSLVTRLLTLIFGGTEPERIVALTFSRLAAGEIFNSFIERLSRAAGSAAVAEEESCRLGRALAQSDFAAMLRKVIACQHLSLIGTLDSFLMRIVRMIPLELGLEGDISVMSDYQSPVERMRLVGEMIMRQGADVESIFRESFRLAFGMVGARGFLQGFSDFIEAWHMRFRDSPNPTGWGNPHAIWPDGAPDGMDVSLAEIRATADAFAPYVEKRGVKTFITAIATFAGKCTKGLPNALANVPLAMLVERQMRLWNIARACERTQGVYLLMRAYEAAYAMRVRRRGRITFDDLPRLLNALDPRIRLPLEYRMDAQFDHWALDEFQDTSRGQWAALSNLIDESLQRGGEKTVFIVGDRKQSIYDWRGGDVEILGEQVRRAETLPGARLESLDESRRYRPAISAAVNAIFGESVVRGLFDMDAAPPAARWICHEHVSHDTSEQGFVEVVQAEKAGKQVTVADFFAPIENALRTVRPWEKGITTAILVRKNGVGERIYAHLKAVGLDKVVFEGESPVADSPVLAAFADLVRLAEHADDPFAYARIRLSPLAVALAPNESFPDAPHLSAMLLNRFTRLGLVRTFREMRESLKTVPATWNAFTESRFEDFIKCAAEFEQIRDETMRLTDFVSYLEHRKRRDFAEPGCVRILTMHRSKGLGFDWVIVPFYERDGWDSARHLEPLEDETVPWLIDNPGIIASEADSVLAAAQRRRHDRQRYDALCLNYVALTRAKKALMLILNPIADKEKKAREGKKAAVMDEPTRFSELVRRVEFQTTGDPAWHLKVAAPQKNQEEVVETLPVPVRRPRPTFVKSRPSESFYRGLTGDRLFSDDFGAAAARGRVRHAEYETVEWIDSALAHTPFERALVRPDATATLWRERAYEMLVDGIWQSGQFDRVVFTGEGGSRSATIYDFKTNELRQGEDEAAFASRLRALYAQQMCAYRAALAHLTGIPLARISTCLLAAETQDVITV